MLDCKSESKHGRIARQSGATTRLTNCRTSNRLEKMLLASFHKCCKIRCVVWTRPTKRSSVESSVGKKLDSLGSKDATVTTVSDRKSTRLNSSHEWISYAVFCLKKKTRY